MAWKPALDDLRSSSRPRIIVRPGPGESASSIALLPGSFDPLTVAHASMADAARSRVDLLVLLLSVRTLPKEGAAAPPLLGDEERLGWLDRFAASRPGTAVGLASRGLLADQVEAAASAYPGAELFVVVGSDKLLQLLDHRWYEDRDAVLGPMLSRTRVLLAMRAGDEERVADALRQDDRWGDHIERLDVPASVAAISSRDVRARLGRGENVDRLVPEELRELLGQISPRSRGGS